MKVTNVQNLLIYKEGNGKMNIRLLITFQRLKIINHILKFYTGSLEQKFE